MITCSNKNMVKSIYTNGVLEAMADAPQKSGGEGKSFSPFELLEASLASCVAITVRMYAQMHNVPLDDVIVNISIDDSNAEKITAKKEVIFKGDLSQEQKDKLLKISESCKIGKILSKGILIQ